MTCEVRFFGGPLNGTSKVYEKLPGPVINTYERQPLPPVPWPIPTDMCAPTERNIIRYNLTPMYDERGQVVWYEALAEGWRRQ